MDISEIKAAYGAYYEASGQNKNRILGMLTQGLVTPGICTPMKTDDTIFRLAQLTIGSLVQSFQKGWTPKNSEAFTPNELRLFHMKVDAEIWPDDVEATWLGFLASDAVDRKDWPLIKFLIEHPEQGYIAKINQDMELLEYGKGVYQAPENGVAGVTGKSMDGLITLIQRGVNNDTMNSVNIGTLNTSTIFDQVETFVDGISEIYQNTSMDVCMSPKWVRAYFRDKRAAGFYDRSSAKEIDESIDFCPQRVKALPSLSGTDTIFATPKPNLIHLTKKSKNKTNIKIEESKRQVSLLCDWWEGLGFGMNACVWTNLKKPAP